MGSLEGPAIVRIWKAGIWTERGFTLIEMMSVLFVMAVLLGLLAPVIHRGQALQEASQSVIGTVRAAYVHALVTRRMQRLCVDLARGEYWVDADSCSQAEATLRDGPVGPHRRTLSPGVRFLDVQTAQQGIAMAGLAAVRFYPIGLTERGIIHLEDQTRSRLSLLIHPLTGMVSVREGYVTEAVSDDFLR